VLGFNPVSVTRAISIDIAIDIIIVYKIVKFLFLAIQIRGIPQTKKSALTN